MLISIDPLFELLDRRNMPPKQLAVQANISLATLYRIRNGFNPDGTRYYPSFKIIEAILQTLQVDMSEIMEFRSEV